MSKVQDTAARRRFLEGLLKGACGLGVFGLGLGVVARTGKAVPADAIRPPGALDEASFTGACSRCGLCVRDCPYDTLVLAELGSGVAMGTPYFTARAVPCEMCEDIPCVKVCPTGALDQSLTDINDARMGVAVLVGHETCLNFLGLRCDVCYRVCPLIDEAIRLELRHNRRTDRHTLFIPVVNTARCTGCGMCEKACVLDEAAIKVLPEAIAVGQLGEHYRLGWEEKRERGKALIDGIVDLPDRGYAPAGNNVPGADVMDGSTLSPIGPEKNAVGGFQEFKP